MSAIPVVAIFDIGKTNKKLFLFDEDYRIVYETSVQLREIADEDGDVCEDIDALTTWIRDSFHTVANNPGFDIRAINYSTYGASFVHLGSDGKPVAPLYNYLKPFPHELLDAFYQKYGAQNEVSRTTASPVLGNLNSGMQLYLLRHRKPRVFSSIRVSLHLPQYVSSLFTGAYCSEVTSIGCHTLLWDFSRSDYHSWVVEEGIASRLAPIRHTVSGFEMEVQGKKMYSGIGLHDSSAALIPYLSLASGPFVLLSTGTWCISLNPFNDTPLTDEELLRDCLCYLTYEGKPVKASRLFSGHTHDEKTAGLKSHFHADVERHKTLSASGDWRRYFRPMDEQERAAIFDRNDYSRFASFEEGYVSLIASLVARQKTSTDLILHEEVSSIYVDGGFSHNRIFMEMLAEAYPNKKVFAASVAQASALGAALVVNDAWNPKRVRKDLLSLERILIDSPNQEGPAA